MKIIPGLALGTYIRKQTPMEIHQERGRLGLHNTVPQTARSSYENPSLHPDFSAEKKELVHVLHLISVYKEEIALLKLYEEAESRIIEADQAAVAKDIEMALSGEELNIEGDESGVPVLDTEETAFLATIIPQRSKIPAHTEGWDGRW